MQLDGAKFRAACRALDRSQAWVARKAGLRSRQALQHHLNGRPISALLYARLVAILGDTDILAAPALPVWVDMAEPVSKQEAA